MWNMFYVEHLQQKGYYMFDINEFRSAVFEDRTEEIELKNFGDSKETLKWKIRALTAEDLAKADEEVQLNRDLNALINMTVAAVSSGQKSDKIDAIKEIIGVSGKVPDVLVKKYAIFELGTVAPKFDRSDTVKFARVYPVEFESISTRIYALTGLGAVKKKPIAYTEMPE
jgi:vacuolar-type H+-ATPase subunit D/Vma8